MESSPRELSSNGNLRLIIVCRQELGKGTDLVINSLPLLLDSFPQVSLDVVGAGNELENLKYRAKLLGLEDRVTFHGRVEQARVLSILRKSDLFCYPTSSEGFPKSVLEALASGLPVITTRVSVLPHLIDPECGVILDKPSAAALADSIKRIGSDRNMYRQMSEKAIQVAAGYTLENWGVFIQEELRRSWGAKFLNSVGEQKSRHIDSIWS